MKAITLHQPWASLVAVEAKRYETRSWRTNYSGPIAIHAAKMDPGKAIVLVVPNEDRGQFVDDAERWLGPLRDLPLGAVLATAHLWGCWRTEQLLPSPLEAQFGNFAPGRFAWKFTGIEEIEPVPARGYQGLWNWERPETVANSRLLNL